MKGKNTRIHFIGIGGTGMSGIAKILINMGYKISGSDLKASDALFRLKDAGAHVFVGHNAPNVEGADMVVISSAIPKTNPEYVRAIELGIPVMHRADMLSLLMLSKKGIAITGAHGKTTTTSMISLIMEKSGLDPTVVIGGELNDIGGNATLGTGEYLVAEADESDGSFMKLSPYAAVLTNIENDHMDYYKDMVSMKNAFKKFVSNVKNEGFIVFCNDNEYVRELAKETDKRYYTVGLNQPADFMPKNIKMNGLTSDFEICFKEKTLGQIQLQVPGIHNIINATCAIALGIGLGIDISVMADAIKTFKGVQRRFQLIDEIDGIKIIDDYAHHPTEIKATLKAARNCNPRKIYAIFQPHRYTRTQLLFEEFGAAFEDADEVIITDIYSAGEDPIDGVSSSLIVDALKRNGKTPIFLPNKSDIADYVLSQAMPGDYAMTIGAGDINDVAYEMAEKIKSYHSEIFSECRKVN